MNFSYIISCVEDPSAARSQAGGSRQDALPRGCGGAAGATGGTTRPRGTPPAGVAKGDLAVARRPWAENPPPTPPPRQRRRPPRCGRGRSAPRVAAPRRPVAMLATWSQGQIPVTRGARNTLTRGQDLWQAAAGLRRLEAVARAHFTGDSPPEGAGAARGCLSPSRGPCSTPTSSTRFSAPVYAPKSQAMGSAAGPGRTAGWRCPVPGDFTASLQRNGSDFTRH